MPEDVTYLTGFMDVSSFPAGPVLLMGWNPAREQRRRGGGSQRQRPQEESPQESQHCLPLAAVGLSSPRQTSPCPKIKSGWLKHRVFQREVDTEDDSFRVDNFTIYI